MLVLIGSLVVMACVLGGFLLSHGQILALWQPNELMIIGGGAIGAFLSANPLKIVKGVGQNLIALFKGPKYRKQDYVDLLSLLYDIFGVMRKQGLLGLESHIEDPQSSSIFSAYPRLVKEHHLIEFITDCLRLMVGGNMNPHELEQLLEVELETHHHEAEAPAMAVMKMADALPGFGIVAAVLGIVNTMSQLGGDTSQIGEHIAGALVGTFLGILLCYGFIGPLGAAMESRVQEDGKAFECVKVALLASLRGYNPKVSVEFARKTLSPQARPNFQDFEDHLKEASRAGASA
ncbi:flagellar motor stator protein MotA [Dyella choica]|uniref:Flagellar motor stator protein MotA n=1 Tax=Dyella choica TaxID=1927959 RepID=A0A432M435_9GAMM|nr:flagellar motor stator protein MotA [Dyella choica]RUL74005.1 flagellar motor stator protein MotA [Dyella choica]